MANNSTPRLKAYRLNEEYSQDTDNDIQSMTDDELLPISIKNLSLPDTEMMVGVKMRQDARLVVEDATTTTVDVTMKLNENGFRESANAICCEGWVLGKGNIKVYVYRGSTSSNPSSIETLTSHNDGVAYGDYSTDQWLELDRKFWDYTVRSEKTYLVSGTPTTVMPASGDYEIHEMDWINFSIGNMLTNSDVFFKQGTYASNFFKIEDTVNAQNETVAGAGIRVVYKTYSELSDGASGTKRAPFGNIYNGNKNGRCLNLEYTDKITNGTPLTSSDTPAHIIENGDLQVNKALVNYYEGNYLFRRKIYPLRFKVIQQNDAVSDFIADAELSNGRAIVPCELSWFMDDIMKPVVFEQIALNGKKIFKQLTRKQVTIQYQQSTGEDGNHYVVALNMSYYTSNNVSRNPKELFFVYNYVDDSLGNIFDFNYDYMTSDSAFNTSTVKYGYANDGQIIPASGQTLGSYVWLKRDALAVRADAGLDVTKDLTLSYNSGTSKVSFTITNTAQIVLTGVTDTDELKEKTRFKNGLSSFDGDKGIKLYIDGIKIYDNTGTETINETGYTVTISNGTVQIGHASASSITEVMVVYYEKHQISFMANGGSNPYCIGYRIPCYEKVKSSTLFVSSFPNWVKGHVNNDLDVFYGNKLYSGTELNNSTTVSYHDIYPEYVKDGWYAMYPEGAIEFNEEKTEQNYFDIMNYSVFSQSPDSTTWNAVSAVGNEPTTTHGISSNATVFTQDYWNKANKLALEYKKVKYNVAHYDGVYSVMRGRMSNYSNKGNVFRYSLMEDEDFMDYVDNRWVGRNDAYIRRMLETGRDEIPRIITISNESQQSSYLSAIALSDNDIATVNTENDRISVFSIPTTPDDRKDTVHVVLSFWSNSTPAGIVSATNDNENYVRVHAKIWTNNSNAGGKRLNTLYLGLESASIGTFNRTNVFGVSDSNVKWVCMPDMEDSYSGHFVGDDVYEGIDINIVQTSEITVDGNASPMKYWMDENDKLDVPQDGIIPSSDDAKVIKYRYHNDDASWSYDVYFEILSYNENNIEVIAYRVMTK